MHKHQILLWYVAYPALPHFSTLSHNQQHDSEKKYCKQNVCFDFLYEYALNIS
jgi:hypothetical protein